jgi:imidazolonepropionase-like amidohydrolase
VLAAAAVAQRTKRGRVTTTDAAEECPDWRQLMQGDCGAETEHGASGWLTLSRHLVLAATVVVATMAVACGVGGPRAAQELKPVGLGAISGWISMPPELTNRGSAAPTSVFLEDVVTEEVTVLPLQAGELTFEASVPPGTYHAYAWSSDFGHRGGHTAWGPGESSEDHGLQAISIVDGETAAGVDIDDWDTPPGTPLVLLGTLIDGTGADPLSDGVIVIREDRIVAVGPRTHVIVPDEATLIDASGATLLPGFINTHVHNAYNRTHLQTWVNDGVTTVRDLGERVGFPYFSTRDETNAEPQYARVISAGPLVTVPGGYPIAGNNFPSLTETSPEDARQKIAKLIDDGADLIKITIESGSGPALSLEEASAIVDTAHQRGVPVSVHVTREKDLRRALSAGVDDIAHMVTDRVPDRIIKQMVAAGVCWVPTLEAVRVGRSSNLSRFIEAGGTVALGNDGGYLTRLEIGMPIREILRMEESGMTPMQVIVSATRNAATVCRRAGLLGTLEVGKLADVLVVDGDPLQDLQALTKVRLVVHSGVVVRDEMPGG